MSDSLTSVIIGIQVFFLANIENSFIDASRLHTSLILLLSLKLDFRELLVFFLLSDLWKLPLLLLRDLLQHRRHFKLHLYVGRLSQCWVDLIDTLVDIYYLSRRAAQNFQVLALILLLYIHQCLFDRLILSIFRLTQRNTSISLSGRYQTNSSSSRLYLPRWQSVSKSLKEIASRVIHHDVVNLAISHIWRSFKVIGVIGSLLLNARLLSWS